MARTRKIGDCGSDWKLLWLAFPPTKSPANFFMHTLYLYQSNINDDLKVVPQLKHSVKIGNYSFRVVKMLL